MDPLLKKWIMLLKKRICSLLRKSLNYGRKQLFNKNGFAAPKMDTLLQKWIHC
jgi:hypothetical protein